MQLAIVQRKGRVGMGRAVRATVISLFLAWTLIPVLLILLTSFKRPIDIFTTVPRLVFQPTLQNYVNAFVRGNFAHYFVNSVIVASATTLLSLSIGTLAAYSLAVGALQVLQQDPPRHSVDHQMVRCQQQHRPPPDTQVEQHRLQQQTGAQVVSGMDLLSYLRHHGTLALSVQIGQITQLQHLHRLGRGVLLAPHSLDTFELHSQRIVVLNHDT